MIPLFPATELAEEQAVLVVVCSVAVLKMEAIQKIVGLPRHFYCADADAFYCLIADRFGRCFVRLVVLEELVAPVAVVVVAKKLWEAKEPLARLVAPEELVAEVNSAAVVQAAECSRKAMSFEAVSFACLYLLQKGLNWEKDAFLLVPPILALPLAN